MSEPEEAYLVCLRIGDADVVVPGSMKKKCRDCSESVWVSPASFALSKERKLPILCVPCAERRAVDDDDVRIQLPTAEQCKEIQETIIKDAIERG